MSLFEWSIPRRRSKGRILPDIPNEIYLEIFNHIAPSSQGLTPEQLRTFTRLSGVCRLFANACLPRTFESIQLSDDMLDNESSLAPLDPDEPERYEMLRGCAFCTQIIAKQPLALNLAKYVQDCHFTFWMYEEIDPEDTDDSKNVYTAVMSHMTNIRRLKLSSCHINVGHWGAIVALPALEELSFAGCELFELYVDCRQRKPYLAEELKLPHLRLSDCTTHYQSLAVIDPRSLHKLTLDVVSWHGLEWLRKCTLTELHIYPGEGEHSAYDFVHELDTLLIHSPPSVKSLYIFLCVESEDTEEILSIVFEALGSPPGLESFTLKTDDRSDPVTLVDAEEIPFEELDALSSLRHLDIFGMVFHLVDGQWSEVSTVTA